MLAPLLLAAAAAAIFYIIAGYPVLLAFFFRRSAPPVRKDMEFRPTVSVLMAVHNGQDFIEKKLYSLLGLNYPADRLEILVISDGSTDRSEAIVESFAGRNIRLLRAPRGGKAAALNMGLRHATGEILFFTDVRQALTADSLAHLAANFADPSVGVVTGEPRFLNPDSAGEEAMMEIYYRYELWVRRRHAQIDSAFNTTGWIYAMRRSLAETLPGDTLIDDAAIPLKAFFQGYRIVVEPHALAFDYPKIEGGEFRRKLRTLAGLWQVHARFPELFTGANRMRFHFLSHKSSRLALPWALLLAWAATIALPASPFQRFLLADEAVFVLLALIDPLLPGTFPLRRITSPARTFLAMNAAALLAVAVFFVPPGTLWQPTRVKPPR